MDGLFYAFDNVESPKIHLLRFYAESEFVIGKVIWNTQVPDVNKELKYFGYKNFQVVGPADEVFAGAFLEGSQNNISFKIENALADSSDTWSRKDVLSFKGKVVSPDELQLSVTSKASKVTYERTYFRVHGNQIDPLKDAVT